MAITSAQTLANFSGFLTPEQSAPIFERAARNSVFQSLARQVPLGASGKRIPVVTTRPKAKWTSEATKKGATEGAITPKDIEPKKLTAIMVDSMEVVRANPGGYVDLMRGSMAEAFAIAFDLAAAHDAGGDGTPGAGPFATYLDQTSKSVELGATATANGGMHVDFVDAMRKIVTTKDASGRRRRRTGWALDDVVEPALWGEVDQNGRPIYVNLPTDDVTATAINPGRLLNRPSFLGEGVGSVDGSSVVGYGGDFSQCAWGVVGGITYKVSTEAAVTVNGELVSAFEENLVVFLAEAEYGWVCADVDGFVKLTNTDNDPVTSA